MDPATFLRLTNRISELKDIDEECEEYLRANIQLINDFVLVKFQSSPVIIEAAKKKLSECRSKLELKVKQNHEKVPTLPVEPVDDDDDDGDSFNPQAASQTQLPGVTGQGTKRKGVEFPTYACQKKPNNQIAAYEIAEVRQKDATTAKPSGIHMDFSIPECLSILRRMPEVEEGGVLYLYATTLFMTPVNREMFVSLEKDDVRLKWLGYLMERDAQGRVLELQD